jgi:hypothetical protein
MYHTSKLQINYSSLCYQRPLHAVQTTSGVHFLWEPEVLSRGVKRPESDIDHSPPFNAAEDKNTWIYTSTPPYRNKFTLPYKTGYEYFVNSYWKRHYFLKGGWAPQNRFYFITILKKNAANTHFEPSVLPCRRRLREFDWTGIVCCCVT